MERLGAARYKAVLGCAHVLIVCNYILGIVAAVQAERLHSVVYCAVAAACWAMNGIFCWESATRLQPLPTSLPPALARRAPRPLGDPYARTGP